MGGLLNKLSLDLPVFDFISSTIHTALFHIMNDLCVLLSIVVLFMFHFYVIIIIIIIILKNGK